jgi:hypothetical protein
MGDGFSAPAQKGLPRGQSRKANFVAQAFQENGHGPGSRRPPLSDEIGADEHRRKCIHLLLAISGRRMVTDFCSER